MPRPKRPRTLSILLVFLLWVDARTFGSLVFPKTSGSYHFFVALDAVWVHFLFGAVTVALAVTATGYLWKASAGWANAVLIAFGVYALQTVIETAVMLRNLPLARTAYAAGREMRGLPVRPDRLDEMFTAQGMYMAAGWTLLILAVLAVAAWRRRDFEAA
jgi:hypothetical protein